MKNFFQINVKTGEKSYAQYVVRSVSSQTAMMQDMSDDDVAAAEKASKLPLWLRITEMICILTAVCLLCAMLNAFADSELSFGETWKRFVGRGGIIIITVAAVCLAVFIALFIWGRVRYKQVSASPELQAVIENREKVQNDGYRELGVPPDADIIDVFGFPFKYNRNGKEVHGHPFARYIPVSVKIFVCDEAMYIADTTELIRIPLSAVTGVDVIPKRVSFYGWTKPQPFKSKEYKPYKIRANNYGTLFIKNCFSVNLLINGEEMQIIIPPYEREIVEKYVHIN